MFREVRDFSELASPEYNDVNDQLATKSVASSFGSSFLLQLVIKIRLKIKSIVFMSLFIIV